MDKNSSITKAKVSNFTINTCFDLKSKSSFCWRYFGNLILKVDGKKKHVLDDQVFCNACLSVAQEDNGDISFGLAKIKSYAKTVSTGNLNRHLRDVHNIKEEEKVTEALKDFFNTQHLSKKAIASTTKSKKKDHNMTLAKNMAVWCCKSFIPFDSISDEGMKHFFQKYKIIGTKDELPSRDTVCRAAFDSLYEITLEDVKAKIARDVDDHAAVTLDLWTDQYRHLNYATFTLHYLTANFEYKSHTLCTKIIDGKITRNKIQAVYNDVMESFGLQDKIIHLVTNTTSEVKLAASLSGLDNHLCLGHALNNLITVDGIRSVTELDTFVRKCKEIVGTIQYRTLELDNEAGDIKLEFTNSMEQLSEILENDDKEPLACKDENLELETEASNLSNSPNYWHTVLAMLECLALLGNRNSLNNVLLQVGVEELKMYQQEWNLLDEIVKFLSKFRDAVEMLTTQKTALNLAMVFHLEVKDILNSLSDEESLIMMALKQKMLAKLDTRFPITDKIVVAAMLDPRFISLSQIDTYLATKGTTRAAFLAEYIKARPRIAASETSPVFVACGTTESILTRLSKKHSSGSSVTYEFDEAELECQKYLATANSERVDDILLYWLEKKSSLPLLSGVARALLAIPVTSTPSKRIFSAAGPMLNAKRCRLNPSCVNKVIFIHDNY